MQTVSTGDNLHEISNPRDNLHAIQILFSKTKTTKHFFMLSAENFTLHTSISFKPYPVS